MSTSSPHRALSQAACGSAWFELGACVTVGLDCTSHRYAYGYYILLVIPMIPWLISAVLTGAALAWSRTFGKKQEVLGIHLGFMCANTEQVKNYGLACLKQSIPFLGVVYNNVCLLAFNTFSCFTLRDGTSVMTAAPLVVCWESEEHRAMVGISIVALIVYVFGFPAITLATTTYARKKDLLRDLTYLKTVGLFYREYGILGRFGSDASRSASAPWCSAKIHTHNRYGWRAASRRFRVAELLPRGLFGRMQGIAVLVITVALIMQFVCRCAPCSAKSTQCCSRSAPAHTHALM
jgi:hypothetical protein